MIWIQAWPTQKYSNIRSAFISLLPQVPTLIQISSIFSTHRKVSIWTHRHITTTIRWQWAAVIATEESKSQEAVSDHKLKRVIEGSKVWLSRLLTIIMSKIWCWKKEIKFKICPSYWLKDLPLMITLIVMVKYSRFSLHQISSNNLPYLYQRERPEGIKTATSCFKGISSLTATMNSTGYLRGVTKKVQIKLICNNHLSFWIKMTTKDHLQEKIKHQVLWVIRF